MLPTGLGVPLFPACCACTRDPLLKRKPDGLLTVHCRWLKLLGVTLERRLM